MSFQIDPGRKAEKQVIDLICHRLQKAATALESGSVPGVHDARKRLKEARGLLRLIREPVGNRLFEGENRLLRDVGQQLAAQRDAEAMVECWDRLVASNPGPLGSAAMKKVRERLAARIPDCTLDRQVLARLLETLQHAGDDVSRLPLKGRGFSLFSAGLHRTYRDGRRALARAIRTPSNENLHEWRKRVKDHWYQTFLLQQAWPEMFMARLQQLKSLADSLGDDHDLAVLQQLIEQQPALFGAASTRSRISAEAGRRRAELFAHSLELGALFYAEKPKALVERWTDLWRLAARHKKALPADPAGEPLKPVHTRLQARAVQSGKDSELL